MAFHMNERQYTAVVYLKVQTSGSKQLPFLNSTPGREEILSVLAVRVCSFLMHTVSESGYGKHTPANTADLKGAIL